MADIKERVAHRYDFYRDGWRTMMLVIPIFALVFVVLTIAVVYSLVREPEPKYFAVEDGRIVPIVPVSNPYIKPGAMNQWVANAVMDLYMIDFQNYRKQINDNSVYFTKDGFKEYLSSLESSGRMKMIMDGWLVGAAVPEGPPIVFEEGLQGGRYTWKVRMPILVRYNSKSHFVEPQRLMITLTIVRVQTTESSYGIGISQFIERPNR